MGSSKSAQALITQFNYEELGMTVITDSFPEGNSDFTSYLTNAKNAGADVIFAPCSISYDQLIIEQAAAQGIGKKIAQRIILELGDKLQKAQVSGGLSPRGAEAVAVASDGSDRPEVKEGESAVYRSSGHYIKLNEDGSVEIKTEKGVDIKGDLRVSGDVWDNTDNPAVSNSMKNMRDILNQQTHGTAVGPSSTGVPPILPSPPPTL